MYLTLILRSYVTMAVAADFLLTGTTLGVSGAKPYRLPRKMVS